MSEPAPNKRCSEGPSFDFANVTNMGQQVRQWLVSRPRQPIFKVETHLGPEDHRKMVQWMTARGYGAMGAPAAESPKGGTNGGMMMPFSQHLHFHYVQEQIVEGCGWFAVSWNFEGCELVLIMAYFKCGEGIQGNTNASLWAGLLAFVTSLQKQVIIMGDFNVAPEVFMTTTMAQEFPEDPQPSHTVTSGNGSGNDGSPDGPATYRKLRHPRRYVPTTS